MNNAYQRFLQSLPNNMKIERNTISTGTDGDLLLNSTTTVINPTTGLISRLRPSSDMKSAMPIQFDRGEVYLAPTIDLQKHDIITNLDDGVVWIVDGVPQLFSHRGQPHHIEATIVVKAVKS